MTGIALGDTSRRLGRRGAAAATLLGAAAFALFIAGTTARAEGGSVPPSDPSQASPSPSASAATPTPTPASPTTGHHGAMIGDHGSRPTATPSPTDTPEPSDTPQPTLSAGGDTAAPTIGPTSHPADVTGATVAPPADTPLAAASVGGDPAPFAPPSDTSGAVAPALNLDSAHIPPIEALSPVSGLNFGSALQLGPILLLVDLLGGLALYYFIRYRWRRPVA